jgi:hypothetical protein
MRKSLFTPFRHSGVVWVKERVGTEGGLKEGEAEVGGESVTEEFELTEAKWVLRLLAMDERLEPKEDQFSDFTEIEVAWLSVRQRVDGCDFLSNSLRK